MTRVGESIATKDIGGYMGKMTKVRNLLIAEYDTCFLNGVLCRKNPYTAHHIVPRRTKIDNSINNLALLCHLEHQMFNAIERDNKRHAEDLNNGFREYKRTKDGLIIVQMREFVDERINALGYEVEDNGKLLVLRRKK